MLTRAAGGARVATPVWLVAWPWSRRRAGRRRALHRSGPAGGGLADLRADRAAGLADQLGSPLGMDRARSGAAHRRGGARPRRGPVGLRGRWPAGWRGVFGAWPEHWTGPRALVPHGLLGFFGGPHPVHEKYHLHGLQFMGWNLFVLAGLMMFAVAVTAAARRPRPGRRREPPTRCTVDTRGGGRPSAAARCRPKDAGRRGRVPEARAGRRQNCREGSSGTARSWLAVLGEAGHAGLPLRPAGGQAARARRGGRALTGAAIAFALALTAYVTDVATHPITSPGWFDLIIYNHAGVIVRHAPATLYTWHFLSTSSTSTRRSPRSGSRPARCCPGRRSPG